MALEQLNIRDHPLAREAARLIIDEVFDGVYGSQHGDDAINEYINYNDPERVTHYALIGAEVGLVAIASLTHSNLPEGMTFIRSMAVKPEFQSRGFGRELLRGIAQQAKRLGNGRIELVANVPQYFERFGFVGRGGMAADVDDVIRKTAAI